MTCAQPRERIGGLVERTPLIESEIARHARLAERRMAAAGRRVQAARRVATGCCSFRPRSGETGVVAFSSGNHAQGVAMAARRLGMRATIVMPADAPQVKRDGTRGAGAEIVFYDRAPRAARRSRRGSPTKRGATLVPSFDDPAIVEGQGSAGLEIAEQIGAMPRRGIVVPCGGGGLAAGIALALPDAEIVVVEPEGWDDMARSLEVGGIVPVAADAPPTACDALQTPRVSPLTFGVLRERGARSRVRSARPKCRRDALRLRASWPGGGARRRGRAGGVACGQGCAARGYGRRRCPAGMSIRRFMRGSSRKRPRRRCVS